MNESTKDQNVYEVSYLLVPSIPQEKVGAEASALSAILAKNEAVIIDQETPSLIALAYEMDKSTGGGTHQRVTEGYFGWFKFSCFSSAIEGIRKAFEQNPHVLRTLAISTIKEKTYLGKMAKSEGRVEGKSVKTASDEVAIATESVTPTLAAPLTDAEIAAVDKKLDEMVKGA